jgi:hypothetical protein
MGFGSYDESEQDGQSGSDIDTDESVNIEDADHDGEVSFESDASNEELVDRLQDIKED